MFWEADIMYFSFFGFRTLLTWIFWSGSAKVPQQQGHLRLIEDPIWEHHNIWFSVGLSICILHHLDTIKLCPSVIAPQVNSTPQTHTNDRTERKVCELGRFNHLWEPLGVQTIPNHQLRQMNYLIQSVSWQRHVQHERTDISLTTKINTRNEFR